MKNRTIPSPEFLRARFRYHRSGKLFWKKRPRSDFATDRACNAWNAKYVGARAGSPMSNGYRLISISGVKFLESRIIFQMMVRPLNPGETVDHRDQDFTNNRVGNFRACTHAKNLMNQPGRRPGGLPKHVYWSKGEEKFKVKMRADGAVHFIGTFGDLASATRAAQSARRRLHGSFADDRRGRQ